MLEDAAVAALNGQITNLTPERLAAACAIVSVDARHAAWIRDIGGMPPAAGATDAPLAAADVRALLQRQGFLAMTPSARLDLAAIDRDGAVREAAEATSTRAALLGGALAAIGALALPAAAAAAARAARPLGAHLRAVARVPPGRLLHRGRAPRRAAGEGADAARVLGQTERAHVKAFRALLGSSAPARPRFDFHGTTEDELAFLHTAVALEDLCVGAYAGQATRIRSPEVLQAAVGIHSVEARHAAWLRRLLDIRPTEGSLDEPRGRRSVVGTIAAKGFVVDASHAPTTHRRASPLFTG